MCEYVCESVRKCMCVLTCLCVCYRFVCRCVFARGFWSCTRECVCEEREGRAAEMGRSGEGRGGMDVGREIHSTFDLLTDFL